MTRDRGATNQDDTGDDGAAEGFDRRVSSIPIDTDPDGPEGGRPVVIQQSNAGPRNEVGGGEFSNVDHAPTPEEAAAEQARLEAEAPTDPSTRPDPE